MTFSADNTIAVTLADGTPVGTAKGAPTVIPAGYYTLLLSGPLTSDGLPYFHLTGPGEDILQNMNEGGILNLTVDAYFAPNSTYTWTNDSLSGVVYTFTTSAVVVGAPPALPTSPAKGAPIEIQDYVGSGIAPLRGTLAASVTAAGKLTIAFKGKAVTALKAGRYRVDVVDRSAKNGLMLEKTTQHSALSLTGVAFVGKHTASIDLTAGRWIFAPRLSAAKTYSIVVS